MSKGDCDTAVALLRRALKLDPDNKVIASADLNCHLIDSYIICHFIDT